MEWYHLITIGVVTGVYVTSAPIRHFIHYLIIKLLQAVIWVLRKTDYYYQNKEPEITPALPSRDYSKTGINMTQEQLNTLLNKRPELRVTEN